MRGQPSTGHVPTARTSMSRRRALGGLGVTLVTLPIVPPAARRAAAVQGQATEVGRAPAGQLAFRLVGTIEQRGFDFTVYGFVMQAINLDPADLFTDDDAFNRSPATARLTFQATVSALARAVHHPLFMVEATGRLTFHLNPTGGADFDAPDSFAAGTEVAAASLSVHNVVNVPQPQVGMISGFAELVLESTNPFTLGDNDYVFGSLGMVGRLSLVGQGVLLDPELPEAVMRIVGDAVSVA